MHAVIVPFHTSRRTCSVLGPPVSGAANEMTSEYALAAMLRETKKRKEKKKKKKKREKKKKNRVPSGWRKFVSALSDDDAFPPSRLLQNPMLRAVLEEAFPLLCNVPSKARCAC
jgi:hypothetical protein